MPMPRLTDQPSGMSCATRIASSSRPSGCQLRFSAMALSLFDLNRRIAAFDVHDPVDIDAWRDDGLGRQFAELGDMLGLYDRQLCRGRHDRVEVATGIAIDEVSPAVGAPRLDQRDIAGQGVFEDAFAAVDDARLLALGELGAGRGWRVEGRDAGRRGAPPFRPRALRAGLELDPAAGIDLLEQHRAATAGKAADDLVDPPLADQPRDALATAPGGVVDDGQVAGAGFDQALD